MAFFTWEKRIQLCALLTAGIGPQRALAEALGCSDRALRRELSRCAAGSYTAEAAHRHRADCAARSAANVQEKAAGLLALQLYTLFDLPWRLSPEQVSLMLGRLSGCGSQRLSTPAIYAWLKRERKLDETALLWRGRGGRRRNHRHGAPSEDNGWVAHAQKIAARGERAAARSHYADYECDSLLGRRSDQWRILVAVERKSRAVQLRRVRAGAQAAAVALEAMLATRRWKSVTSDRGGEFAYLPARLGKRFFLCDAHRADQRGGCENLNGLAREFFPAGDSIDKLSDDDVAHAELCLNMRPRRSLNGLAPIDLLHLL